MFSRAIGAQSSRFVAAPAASDLRARTGMAQLSKKPSPAVILEVADTGKGIPREVEKRIFDPFFSSKFTGRGLGMSAVLGIIRAHKGAIFLDSAVGQGTTIRILFSTFAPVLVPDDAGALPPTGARDFSTLTGTILVADDDPEVREVCREYLQHLGFEVMLASDGREAVQLYREHADEIICVLLDMMMPILDGLGTFQELKHSRADIPVILCSGYNALEATRRFSSEGLAGFIQKPFRLLDLQTVIEHVLQDARKASA